MPGVHSGYLATQRFGLVFKESAELCERPRVKTPFGVPSAGFYTGSDVREIFDDNGCAGQDAQ